MSKEYGVSKQEIFIKKFDEVLKMKGLTRKQFSELGEIAESTMSRWHKSVPRESTLRMIEDKLGLTEGYFDFYENPDDKKNLMLHSMDAAYEDYQQKRYESLTIDEKIEEEVILSFEPEMYSMIHFLKSMGYGFVYNPESRSGEMLKLIRKAQNINSENKNRKRRLEEELKKHFDRLKEKDWEDIEWYLLDSACASDDKDISKTKINSAIARLRVNKLQVHINGFIKALEKVLNNDPDARIFVDNKADREIVEQAIKLLKMSNRSDIQYDIERALKLLSSLQPVSLKDDIDDLVFEIDEIKDAEASTYINEMNAELDEAFDVHSKLRIIGKTIDDLSMIIEPTKIISMRNSLDLIHKNDVHGYLADRRRLFRNIVCGAKLDVV